MEYDAETQKKIALHHGLVSAIGKVAHQFLEIEDLIQQDLEFYEKWMEDLTGKERVKIATAEPVRRFLRAAKELAEAHREILTIGMMLATGTEDTGKYKM